MAMSESLPPLSLPDDEMWRSLDLVCGQELHGGFQSRVFDAERDGERIAVKLTDSRLVDSSFHRRLEVMSLLADTHDSVVRPIKVGGAISAEIGSWFAVVYPFAEGRVPDEGDEADVRRMASTMASLHRSLDQLESVDLPLVAALVGSEQADAIGRWQLLHGDFSSANLLFAETEVRVFDFDDCGYGPVEFEVGNTLYMVLFDAVMSSDMDRYQQFRSWFVDQYRSASGREVSDELLDASIRLRVQALQRWIDQPETAPIGIRNASPAWRESLRIFVQSQTRD